MPSPGLVSAQGTRAHRRPRCAEGRFKWQRPWSTPVRSLPASMHSAGTTDRQCSVIARSPTTSHGSRNMAEAYRPCLLFEWSTHSDLCRLSAEGRCHPRSPRIFSWSETRSCERPWRYWFGGAGTGSRLGSRERHRFTERIFGLLWSRSRVRDGSASGKGMPPCGGSGEAGGRSGPDPPLPSSSEGPGRESRPWHDKTGTTMNAAIRISHASATATRDGATNATISTKHGQERQPSDTRAQKFGRRPMVSPATTQTVIKASSTATSRTTIAGAYSGRTVRRAFGAGGHGSLRRQGRPRARVIAIVAERSRGAGRGGRSFVAEAIACRARPTGEWDRPLAACPK